MSNQETTWQLKDIVRTMLQQPTQKEEQLFRRRGIKDPQEKIVLLAQQVYKKAKIAGKNLDLQGIPEETLIGPPPGGRRNRRRTNNTQ